MQLKEFMKFGIFIPSAGHFTKKYGLKYFTEKVEDLGFNSLWVSDHIIMPKNIKAPYPFAKDKKATWDKVLEDGGSIQDIKELDNWGYVDGKLLKREDIPQEAFDKDQVFWVKDVFKTFKEINQLELIRQAGVRQQYIDQSVSLNLAFPSEASPKWINQVTLEAWKQGIKTLYYMRTESVLRGDIAARALDPDCVSCDG